MKTIEVKLYNYGELSDEAKEKVLNNLCDINVDCDWWECTYEDAAQIGLEIDGFDIGRGNEISGKLLEDPRTIKRLILENHGKSCDTYKYVKEFDMRSEIDEDDFIRGLLEEYLSMLRKEYEYQTTEESIKETIEANEYEFTESGNWPVI